MTNRLLKTTYYVDLAKKDITVKFQNKSRLSVCCVMACVAGSLIFSMSNQAKADIVYRVSGFANNLGPDVPFLSPQVGLNESYTAVFEVDDSIVDSDSSPALGDYIGAIVSSSIQFSDGYTSTVNFFGGDVTVIPGNAGTGISLVAPDFSGAFLLFSTSPLDSDALLTEPQEFSELPGSSWFLTEPDGSIIADDPVDPNSDFVAASTFAVTSTAVPEPSAMGLLGLGLVVASVRRRRS